MPRCYMVKKFTPRHEGSQPCSPTGASVAPPCYSPNEDSANTGKSETKLCPDGLVFSDENPSKQHCDIPSSVDYGDRKELQQRKVEYAELGGGPLSERSAEDTEAALELLSLAHSLPPLPPAAIDTVLQAPEPTPVVPVYAYTPTNFYILTEEPPAETVYQTVQTITAAPSVQYTIERPVNYVAYEPQQAIEMVEYTKLLPKKEKPSQIKRMVNKYDCRECGKRYATSSNLSRHKQTHRSLDSGAAKRCTECGKVYVSMPALAMHMLTHRMGHVCSVCGKQFSRPWLLRGHSRSHTGEKPYTCTACGKAFADRSNLRAHLQTHSSDKKYECSRCRKTFALKSYLNKHQESACGQVEEQ